MRTGTPSQRSARFAIESQLKNGVVVERLFLRGLKRFEDQDKGLPAGTPVPTSEHPVQSFQWADYAVKPERKYRYRIVPAYGQPMLMELRDASATTIDVSTPDAQQARRNFNRGAAASQAYARVPDNHIRTRRIPSRQMEWLSRGLFEALIAHRSREGPTFALRGAFSQFHYLPVGVASRGDRCGRRRAGVL
jgi:hypothetical protein